MPHILVEHSAKSIIDTSTMLDDLHQTLAKHDTIDLKGLKSRSVEVDHCIVGDADQDNTMVHITLRLLPGRSDELRTAMAKSLQGIARNYTKDTTSVTAEVVEMDAVSYCK